MTIPKHTGSYDARCYDLAEVFLDDDATKGDRRVCRVDALATHIQEAIEGWLEMYPAAIPEGPFVCPKCGRTSYHPKDREERYCGACHVFVP
jgi:hypothetical protein